MSNFLSLLSGRNGNFDKILDSHFLCVLNFYPIIKIVFYVFIILVYLVITNGH